jgi:hypothetical protein
VIWSAAPQLLRSSSCWHIWDAFKYIFVSLISIFVCFLTSNGFLTWMVLARAQAAPHLKGYKLFSRREIYMKTTDSESSRVSITRNSSTSSTKTNSFKEIMREIGHDWDDPGSPDAHARDVPESHQGQATRTGTVYETPPTTDNEFNDYDHADFANPSYPPNYSDESSIHAPAQVTSTVAQSPRATEGCSAATGFRPTSSISIPRHAPSKPTAPAIPEIPRTPHTLRRMSREIAGLAAIAQTAVEQSQAGNDRMASEELIDPALRGQTTAPSHNSKPTREARFESVEFIPHTLLDDNRVRVSETMVSGQRVGGSVSRRNTSTQ